MRLAVVDVTETVAWVNDLDANGPGSMKTVGVVVFRNGAWTGYTNQGGGFNTPALSSPEEACAVLLGHLRLS